MHEELEAMGGKIVPFQYGTQIYFDVYIDGVVLGAYYTQPTLWGSFEAYYESEIQGGFTSERAAVDWLIAQYFLFRANEVH